MFICTTVPTSRNSISERDEIHKMGTLGRERCRSWRGLPISQLFSDLERWSGRNGMPKLTTFLAGQRRRDARAFAALDCCQLRVLRARESPSMGICAVLLFKCGVQCKWLSAIPDLGGEEDCKHAARCIVWHSVRSSCSAMTDRGQATCSHSASVPDRTELAVTLCRTI